MLSLLILWEIQTFVKHLRNIWHKFFFFNQIEVLSLITWPKTWFYTSDIPESRVTSKIWISLPPWDCHCLRLTRKSEKNCLFSHSLCRDPWIHSPYPSSTVRDKIWRIHSLLLLPHQACREELLPLWDMSQWKSELWFPSVFCILCPTTILEKKLFPLSLSLKVILSKLPHVYEDIY